MVLIFSSPWRVTIASKALKHSLIAATSSCALMRSLCGVKSSKSVNRMDTPATSRALASPNCLSSSAMGLGRMLSNNLSLRWRSTSIALRERRMYRRRLHNAPAITSTPMELKRKRFF